MDIKELKKLMEIHTTDSTFEKDVIQQSKKILVLVDFWASWCGPCMMLGPILEKVAEDYDKKIVVAKLNVEDNQEISSKFNIMSIPAVKLFKDGKVVDEFVGVKPESAIKDFIDKNL